MRISLAASEHDKNVKRASTERLGVRVCWRDVRRTDTNGSATMCSVSATQGP